MTVEFISVPEKVSRWQGGRKEEAASVGGGASPGKSAWNYVLAGLAVQAGAEEGAGPWSTGQLVNWSNGADTTWWLQCFGGWMAEMGGPLVASIVEVCRVPWILCSVIAAAAFDFLAVGKSDAGCIGGVSCLGP